VGIGSLWRELMYVGDDGLFLMEHYTGNEPINIELSEDRMVRELADLAKRIVGYGGEIVLTPASQTAPYKSLWS